jgi:hypothetical protein
MFYGTNATNNAGGDSFVEVNAPLPVSLTYFGANKFEDRHSLLKWTTSSEINTSHFEIERSFDGISWKKVGEVDAAVYSNELKSYSFLDENVFNGRSKSLTAFYRMRMVDLDDHHKFSPIESVLFTSDLANTTPYLAYPNPAREGVTIEWDANALGQPTSIELYDLSGKLIHVQEVAPNSNQEYIDFVSARASTGMCMVRLLAGTETLDVKQIIIGQN